MIGDREPHHRAVGIRSVGNRKLGGLLRDWSPGRHVDPVATLIVDVVREASPQTFGLEPLLVVRQQWRCIEVLVMSRSTHVSRIHQVKDALLAADDHQLVVAVFEYHRRAGDVEIPFPNVFPVGRRIVVFQLERLGIKAEHRVAVDPLRRVKGRIAGSRVDRTILADGDAGASPDPGTVARRGAPVANDDGPGVADVDRCHARGSITAVLRNRCVDHVADSIKAPGLGERRNELLGAIFFLAGRQIERIELAVGGDHIDRILANVDIRRCVQAFGTKPHAIDSVDDVGLELLFPDNLAVGGVNCVKNVAASGCIDESFLAVTHIHSGNNDGSRQRGQRLGCILDLLFPFERQVGNIVLVEDHLALRPAAAPLVVAEGRPVAGQAGQRRHQE